MDSGVMMLIASRRVLFCTIYKYTGWQGTSSTQAIFGLLSCKILGRALRTIYSACLISTNRFSATLHQHSPITA